VVSAYVLVKLSPRAEVTKISHALNEPGVKSVEMIIGPWDAVILCEALDVDGLGEISRQVRSCPGIADSLTCPVVQLS